MNVVVFAGPTISHQDAATILDATYLPPIKQGDMLSIVHDLSPDLIAIIDGTIFFEMPVWHKEILYALDNGVMVYGASAIGALRAVELEPHGMRGVGQVYEKFKRLELEDDDEVLCRFGKSEEGYLRHSEPMVNIRATFEYALTQGVIDSGEYTKILSIAKSIYYPQRTFSKVFEQACQANMPKELCDSLEAFVAEHYVDIQRRDAVELLETISSVAPSDVLKNQGDFDSYGTLFHTLYDRDRRSRINAELDMPFYAIANYVGLTHPDAEDINFHALNRKLVRILADTFGITAADQEIEKEKQRFRKKHQLLEDVVFDEWLLANDLTPDGFGRMMKELARVRKLQQWFIMIQGYWENTQALLEELKLSNEYVTWKTKTASREILLQDREEALKEVYNRDGLAKLFKEFQQYKEFPWNVSPIELMAETGISLENFALELAKEKVVRERAAAAVDQSLSEV